MQRVRLDILILLAAAGLALAACNAPTDEPTVDATGVALSVQESQTAAAQATGAALPNSTATPAPTEAAATGPAEATESAEASATAEVTATPTATATPTEAASPTAGPGPVSGPTSETPGEPGTITGALGYPSEVIPRLRVYAWDQGSGQWRYVITNQNDSTFALQVPPGKYIVFAYLNDGGEIAGGYTNAVLCGLSVECTDHTLYVVTVGSGQQVSGVNVTDWYGPPGSIPQPPG